MKKINIFLSVAAIILLLAGGVSATSEELVYLNVNAVSVSSFDTTADWAPLPDVRATVDGNLLTRWSSQYKDEQWISFDFGMPKVLSKMIIVWEDAYPVDYDILISQDNENWQTILSLKDKKGGVDEVEIAPVKTRYVKILAKKRFNPLWGISAWEILCLGPASENYGDLPLAEVYPQLPKQLAEKQSAKSQEQAAAQGAKVEMEAAVDSPGALTLEEFQKGVVYTSWSKTELGSEPSDLTLEYLKELGVRNLAIMIVWLQDSIKENIIHTDPKDTVDDKALAHVINKAHSLGMKVMLKPHVDVKTGEWRGDIIPGLEWFDSYKKYITHYAEIAAKYNVELFCIGTELVNTTIPTWQGQWEDVIKRVKGIFNGRLVYSANWNEYKEVDFWDKLDFIGIDAYFPLTGKNDPTKEELISAWKANAMDIDRWLKEEKMKKPVIFSEIGYSSADTTNTQPWVSFTDMAKDKIDQQEQADCLEALLAVCPAYPWFKGLYWWNYFPQERWSPLGYIIRGKKAEEVFSNWLKQSS